MFIYNNKTKCMIIETKQRLTNVDIHSLLVNDNALKFSFWEKLVGVKLDDTRSYH